MPSDLIFFFLLAISVLHYSWGHFDDLSPYWCSEADHTSSQGIQILLLTAFLEGWYKMLCSNKLYAVLVM